MAKIVGVFTGYKGKVGNTVYAMWKGIQTFKTRSQPSNPQSADQTKNRTLFSTFIGVFKPLISNLVVPFWNVFATSRQTGWGNLIGANQLKQAGGTINYEALVVSKGSLPLDPIVAGTYTTGSGIVSIEWSQSGCAGSADEDFAMGAVYDKGTGKWYFSSGSDTRVDEGLDVATESGLTLADLTVYLFFFTGVIGPGTITSVSDNDGVSATAP